MAKFGEETQILNLLDIGGETKVLDDLDIEVQIKNNDDISDKIDALFDSQEPTRSERKSNMENLEVESFDNYVFSEVLESRSILLCIGVGCLIVADGAITNTSFDSDEFLMEVEELERNVKKESKSDRV
ncbi:hypothetical protein ACH5RR_008051 [Cinchona calisaya]|uniref:Uncharacterized protein n=1 Tax=Cinchona calisaya TaxID=153742 RepID=A0ABD3AAM9_9GENT